MSGIVYLVGAGPGDADLITVRGLNCLQRADVVAYDRLAPPELLHEAPPAARLVNVGKAPGRHRYSQGEINALLIREAQRGRAVVRLKGGDPFVFGRGGEECLALRAAGVPYEVVPGVTSAVAAPAFAGIPVTHRGEARSFTVVTGHTAGSERCDLEWPALAQQETLVFLMGVRTLPHIAEQLVAHGRSPHTPVAVVSNGGTASQRVVSGTLATIAGEAAAVSAPATIVVGAVAALHEQLDWFAPGKVVDTFALLPASQAAVRQEARYPETVGYAEVVAP